MKIRIDKDLSTFARATLVFLAFVVGLFFGGQIGVGYKDAEIATIRAALETERASLAEANQEAAFLKSTLKLLAEGHQLGGIELKASDE